MMIPPCVCFRFQLGLSPFGSIRALLVPAHAHVPGPGHVSQLTSAPPQVTFPTLVENENDARGVYLPPISSLVTRSPAGPPHRECRCSAARRSHTIENTHAARSATPHEPCRAGWSRNQKQTTPGAGNQNHTLPPRSSLLNENENGGRCGVPLNYNKLVSHEKKGDPDPRRPS